MGNYTIVVPARSGSKGVPHKNRMLIQSTLNIVSESMRTHTIITTDDEVIIEAYQGNHIVHRRSIATSSDTASMKSVMLEVVNAGLLGAENIIVLYPTYPTRTWEDVLDAINFFERSAAKSLLCRIPYIGQSPYLLMHPVGEYCGRQVIDHDLYRRQDYLPVFELSHCVCIFSASILHELNQNLYNRDTVFMDMCKKVDVDTEQDISTWKQN